MGMKQINLSSKQRKREEKEGRPRGEGEKNDKRCEAWVRKSREFRKFLETF